MQPFNRSPVDQQAFSTALLYHMVKLRVESLTRTEYDAAVQLTARKYHLPQRFGHLDLEDMSVGRIAYISDLVTEAVGQARISEGTIAVERAARDIEQHQPEKIKEGNGTV